MAIAGMPRSTARVKSPSSREAPSSMEYSVWTWRWTKESWEPFAIVAGHLLASVVQGIADQGRGGGRGADLGKDASLRDHCRPWWQHAPTPGAARSQPGVPGQDI